MCFRVDQALPLFWGHTSETIGGAEKQLHLIVSALARDPDFNVRVIVPHGSRSIEADGITFAPAAKPPIKRGLPYVSRLINRARARAPFGATDPVILFQVFPGHSQEFWSLARSLGYKFVYRTSTDADTDETILGPSLAASHFSMLRDADAVIAQTEHQKGVLLKKLGVSATVIPNMVGMPAAAHVARGRYVLWVGRANAVKRPWHFVELARRLPHLSFVMVMPPQDPTIMRSVQLESRWVSNLEIVEGVPNGQMDDYYRDAAVLVNTSAHEGMPNVFLEAAVWGTPVISLDVNPGGLLSPGPLGICANGEVDELRRQVEHLATHPETLETMGKAASQHVAHMHSEEYVMPLIKNLLRSVAAP